MGRKRISFDELKRERVISQPKVYRTISLRKEEDEQLYKEAFQANMSISKYIRFKLFGNSILTDIRQPK